MAFIYDKETDMILFMTSVENPLNDKTFLRSVSVSGEAVPGAAVGRKTKWSLLSLGLLYALQRAL